MRTIGSAVYVCLHDVCYHRPRAAPQQAASDSTFLLVTGYPHRSLLPFIGNGRLGVVIPPLGIGASASYQAGLYEHAHDDVPRIVAIPAWNAIAVFDGDRWIGHEAGTGARPRPITGTGRTCGPGRPAPATLGLTEAAAPR